MGILQTLREILGNLKLRKPRRKLCPKCCDQSIHLSRKFDIWLLPEQYVCDSCGYTGSIALEVVEDGKMSVGKALATQ
ncbi:hypothetical protein KAH85_03175 [Candidatus Bathyarchaeota archaeon]|nr:hypothetical protein [Candidatus Bathyarchaeota archaeon]